MVFSNLYISFENMEILEDDFVMCFPLRLDI
jgi:hypothetical protein